MCVRAGVWERNKNGINTAVDEVGSGHISYLRRRREQRSEAGTYTLHSHTRAHFSSTGLISVSVHQHTQRLRRRTVYVCNNM